MISNNPTEPQASSLRDTQAGPLEVPLMKPNDPIEETSPGNGTPNDPSPTDTRPPRYEDLELMA